MKLNKYSLFLVSILSLASHAQNLSELYQMAQKKDPIIRQMQANRDSAYAKIQGAKAQFLPQIYLTGDLRKANNSGSNTVQLTLNQSLFDKSIWENFSLVEQQATLAELQYQNVSEKLLIRTTEAYFNTLQAQDTLAFSKANEQAVAKQMNQVKKRYEVGLTAITDVQETTASYHQAVANVIRAENEVRNQFEVLWQLTGQALISLAPLDTQRFSTPGTNIELATWEQKALNANKDLLISRATQDISKAQIRIAQAGHYPDLNFSVVGSSVDITKNSTNSIDQGRQNSIQAAVTINIPIYSGGGTTALVKSAQYDYVNAAESLEDTKRTMIRNLRSFFNNVQANKSSVSAYEKLEVSAQTALEATESGYNVGTRTIVDVLNATQNLYAAKQQLSQSRYQYMINILQLKRTAGTLTQDDLNEVNQRLINTSS